MENQMIDLESLRDQELINECMRWRTAAPRIIEKLELLDKFLDIAPNAESLKSQIDELRNSLMGAIALKDEQIKEMTRMIEYLKEDPLGIDRKFKNQSK
jgi:hypothetical protein